MNNLKLCAGILLAFFVLPANLYAEDSKSDLPGTYWTTIEGEVSMSVSDDGLTVFGIDKETKRARLYSAPFPVEPDAVYRVRVKFRRAVGSRIGFVVREAGSDNGYNLGAWPGYRPIAPYIEEAESYFATNPGDESAQLEIELSIDSKLQVEEAEFALKILSVKKVGSVTYLEDGSANYAFNGKCELADEKGVAVGFGRWGGPHDAKVVKGVGIDGSGALVFDKSYLLICADVPALKNVRYRFQTNVKGQGRAILFFRGVIRNQPVWNTSIAKEFQLEGEEWKLLNSDTVVLPGMETITAVLHLIPAGGQALTVDNVQVKIEPQKQ
jgi:hypothetical protein